MSNSNSFSSLLALAQVLDNQDLYELRMDNSSGGAVLYVGKSQTPSASQDDLIWYIKKLSYDLNGFINYVQLPDDGAGFTYAWSQRTTYFS